MLTVILNYSALIKSDINQSLQAFAELYHCPPEALQQPLEELQPLIDAFKIGDLPEYAFFCEVQAHLSQTFANAHVTIEQLKVAWNAMSIIAPSTLAELTEIQEQFQKYDPIQFIILGRSNETHYNSIRQQLADAQIQLNCTEIMSFSIGSLDLPTLLASTHIPESSRVISLIPKADLEIQTPCTYSNMGLLDAIKDAFTVPEPVMFSRPKRPHHHAKKFLSTHNCDGSEHPDHDCHKHDSSLPKPSSP